MRRHARRPMKNLVSALSMPREALESLIVLLERPVGQKRVNDSKVLAFLAGGGLDGVKAGRESRTVLIDLVEVVLVLPSGRTASRIMSTHRHKTESKARCSKA